MLRFRPQLLLPALAVLAVSLSGCAAEHTSSPGGDSSPASSPSATATPGSAASSGSSASSDGSGSSGGSGSSDDSGASGAEGSSDGQQAEPSPGASAQPSNSPTPGAQAKACPSSGLTVALSRGDAAAGSVHYSLIFTNNTGEICTIDGTPGVSLVGGGNGTQIGMAASWSSPDSTGTTTLMPGDSASAPLSIAQAANFDDCNETTADGLRVYPPHSKNSIFVKADGLVGCDNNSLTTLQVQPVSGR